MFERQAQSLAQLLTTAEVCTRLRLSRAAIHRLVRKGKLEPVRFGRAVRFREADVAALIDQHAA